MWGGGREEEREEERERERVINRECTLNRMTSFSELIATVENKHKYQKTKYVSLLHTLQYTHTHNTLLAALN